MDNKEQIIDLENKLREAMLNSDVELSNKLLSEEMLFTSHFGQVFTKEDDLAAHREGFVKINMINLSEQVIKFVGETAIVNVKAEISGSFGGSESSDVLRYTRVWAKTDGINWQVIAGQASPIA